MMYDQAFVQDNVIRTFRVFETIIKTDMKLCDRIQF